jgi:uncharacterized Zn finger protein (UPF0148 family)
MTSTRWLRSELPLVVTPQGICGICPECGAHILLVSDDDIDSCPECGTLLRVTVETRAPWAKRGTKIKEMEREEP